MSARRETEASGAPPSGVVLAGGLSRRMGSEKSLILLAGRPLILYGIDRLRPAVGALAISANGDPRRFEPFGLPVLADTVAGHPGPLAGLLAGMEWARRSGAQWLLTAPADSPFIPTDLVEKLSAAAGTGRRPALAASGGRVHPVAGLWPTELAAQLRAFLDAGTTYRVSAFAEQAKADCVEFPTIQRAGHVVDPFFNVNTPEDLAAAEEMLQALSR